MAQINFEEVLKGINMIWNNKFDEAEKLFQIQATSVPRYALHQSEAIFLKSFITADTEDTHNALERLSQTKHLAESHIKAYEKGHVPGDETKKVSDPNVLFNSLLDARIVLGDSLYMLAILQMTRDAKLKGALNLRKSWKAFEKALKDTKTADPSIKVDPHLTKCLHFGAGFFLFAVSIIPQKFLKFIELAGFKSDRDAGLNYVRGCYKEEGIRTAYATMLLLFNNLLLPRGLSDAQEYIVEASSIIKDAVTKYPDGSLFHVMASHCARKQCKIDEGIKMMEIALENCKGLKQQPLIYQYELANCYCMKLEWKAAAELYAPLLNHTKFQVRAFTALQLATCCIMLGEHDRAVEWLNKAQTFANKKSSLDSIIVRQSKRYISCGGHFAAFEVLYLRRDFAKMLPLTDQIVQVLDALAAKTNALEKKQLPENTNSTPATSPGKLGFGLGKLKALGSQAANLSPFAKRKENTDYSFDDRATYLLLKGSLLKSIGKVDQAIEHFKELLDMQDVLIEKFYVPYCLYELGECHYLKKNVKEAEEAMKKCSKISGYDWEDPLRVRLRVTMDQLKKIGRGGQSVEISIDSLTSTTSGNDTESINSNDNDESDEEIDDEELKKKLHITEQVDDE